MNPTSSSELFWLVLTLVMTALLWLPYIVNRILELGVWATLSTPSLQPKAAWADRLMQAHRNAVENLAVFAPLVLALGIVNIHTATTATAAMVYFWARLAHVLVYAAAIPVARTLAFLAGFTCQMALAYTLLQHL